MLYFLSVIILLFSSTLASAEIILYTEEYKPFQYKNKQGQLDGFGIDLVKKIFINSPHSIKNNTIYMYPWIRSYNYVLDKKNSAVFMTVRTPKREHLFKWVGPLLPRKIWLYKLQKRTDITLKNLTDINKYVIGGYINSSDTLYLKELGIKVESIPKQSLLTNMLVNGHLDIIPSLEVTMKIRLKDLGMDSHSVKKLMKLDDRYDYYLAFNVNTSDEIISDLQQSLDRLKHSSFYKQLVYKYNIFPK